MWIATAEILQLWTVQVFKKLLWTLSGTYSEKTSPTSQGLYLQMDCSVSPPTQLGFLLLGAAHPGWRPPHFSLSLHLHVASASVSPIPLCFSLTKALVMALWWCLEPTWVIQKGLISRFFTLLHLQRLFTGKVVFRGSRDQYVSISSGHSSQFSP